MPFVEIYTYIYRYTHMCGNGLTGCRSNLQDGMFRGVRREIGIVWRNRVEHVEFWGGPVESLCA